MGTNKSERASRAKPEIRSAQLQTLPRRRGLGSTSRDGQARAHRESLLQRQVLLHPNPETGNHHPLRPQKKSHNGHSGFAYRKPIGWNSSRRTRKLISPNPKKGESKVGFYPPVPKRPSAKSIFTLPLLTGYTAAAKAAISAYVDLCIEKGAFQPITISEIVQRAYEIATLLSSEQWPTAKVNGRQAQMYRQVIQYLVADKEFTRIVGDKTSAEAQTVELAIRKVEWIRKP